mgnify:CR=1 FL=1
MHAVSNVLQRWAEIPQAGKLHAVAVVTLVAAILGLPGMQPAAVAEPKPAFRSPVITAATPGHAVEIDVPLNGARQLYLVATDGGNGYSCDWADWANPRLIGKQGELKLTDLKWKSATTGWGQVQVNRNCEGGPLRIAGRAFDNGIGTHANSIIHFELPPGYDRFQAIAGLDEGGTRQGGDQSSVQFAVFFEKPTLPGPGLRTPQDGIAALDVADGLEVAIFAAEPLLQNPANIDIDHRGRVWVCEAVNYRNFQNKDVPPREAGDRILILEDTDGDGQADREYTFYQGRDIDSPHGVCVLGTPDDRGLRAIVSAGDSVVILTDDDGDLKADRKEVLFTGISGNQHDHGIHSALVGPDGRLYFNFGNEGRQLKDAKGNIVIDRAGNPVVANRQPYQEGLAFRCNLDGSDLETLGWNFRNNWELAVDSFGGIWQSDNDDDGNRGVRINFVMEFGNYGYKDELTGAGWRTPRIGMAEEIPRRHWHQNDPGVVPNLLPTGAGSPTGILVYEGELLPPNMRGQLIHCDAGPNVVRVYEVQPDGAGYKATMANVLHGARDNWFRPSDVCTAPDGSIIVADWYDPGVGGHRMGDVERGRLFRVAPPGAAYKMPKFDFSTVEGAIAALKNPNVATRYVAQQALRGFGNKAVPALKQMAADANPVYRARALWLLAAIPSGSGDQVAEAARQAAADADPNVRSMALRILRQYHRDPLPMVAQLVKDPSPAVRRECFIALRGSKSAEMPRLWAILASQHDGNDRWYVEAAGIGAAGRWDECLEAYLKQQPTGSSTDLLASPAVRDMVWRSRAEATPRLLAEILERSDVTAAQAPRYLRAFDFQDSPLKQQALLQLAFTTAGGDREKAALINEAALERLPATADLASNAEYRRGLERVIAALADSSKYVQFVEKFRLADQYDKLLELAQRQPDAQTAADAIRALFNVDAAARIQAALTSSNLEQALATVQALATAADGRAMRLLMPVVQDAQQPLELRRQATRALAKTRNGALALIKLAEGKQLDADLVQSAAFELHLSNVPEIKSAAEKYFPLPESKDAQPLPPISQLVKMQGDAARGLKVFTTNGTCNKCHVVRGQGKDVGPDLSEIGSKLSREAMFESILYPSAGISHNYESYALLLASGNVVVGIITSETPEAVTIKKADGLVEVIPVSEIEEREKQKISLMPADLQKVMSAQDLVDVVEYLQTLKKVTP